MFWCKLEYLESIFNCFLAAFVAKILLDFEICTAF